MNDDAAFEKGYRDFPSSPASSLSRSSYDPPPGMAEAYAAGWQKASDETERAALRASRRSDLVGAFVLGGFLFAAGVGMAVLSIVHQGGFVLVPAGMIVGGAALLVKGLRALLTRKELQ